MKIKKRRGFTIIEMIVAIAFFTIATVGISFVISTSANMYKMENTKFQTISVADSIINQLKSRGILETDASSTTNITGLNYFFGATSDVDEYRYIFLNYDELSSQTLIHGSYIVAPIYSDDYSSDLANFQSCKTDNINNKRFGAFVHISRNNGDKTTGANYNIDYYYNTYTIDVKVWDLNKDVNSEAHESTSISR